MSEVYLLEPVDPLFFELGKRFIELQAAAYGTDHVYNADTYNEMVSNDIIFFIIIIIIIIIIIRYMMLEDQQDLQSLSSSLSSLQERCISSAHSPARDHLLLRTPRPRTRITCGMRRPG
jgi:hypothetical protein